MWANAQRDGRPARKVWLTPTTCSNAAKARNPLKFAGVPLTIGSISAASGPSVHHVVRTCGGHTAA